MGLKRVETFISDSITLPQRLKIASTILRTFQFLGLLLRSVNGIFPFLNLFYLTKLQVLKLLLIRRDRIPQNYLEGNRYAL